MILKHCVKILILHYTIYYDLSQFFDNKKISAYTKDGCSTMVQAEVILSTIFPGFLAVF